MTVILDRLLAVVGHGGALRRRHHADQEEEEVQREVSAGELAHSRFLAISGGEGPENRDSEPETGLVGL